MPLDAPLPEVIERFQSEFDACEMIRAFADDKIAPWSGRPVEGGTVDVIVIGEAAKATKTYRGALMLAAGGFGQQALMLGRSVFEAALVSHWAVAYPEEAVTLFNQHDRYTRILWGDTLRSLGWYEPPDVSEDERAELAALFGDWGEKPWTRRGNYTLRKEIEHMWDDGGEQLGLMYKLGLRESNLILHSSAWALSSTMTGVEGDDVYFEGGPSSQFVDRALHLLMWSYSQIVGLVMDHFAMPDREQFSEVFQQAHDAFGSA